MAPTGPAALGPAYQLYFNEEEETKPRQNDRDGSRTTAKDVSNNSFLDLVEKHSKMVARARSHGQPQKYVSLVNDDDDVGTDDEEETVFYENNNLCVGGASAGDADVHTAGHMVRVPAGPIPADGPKKGRANHPSIFTFPRHFIAICLLCVAFLALYLAWHDRGLDLRTTVGLPAHFNVTYRIVIEGLQVDTNLATLPLANNTRALFFSAGNTIVCARIDDDHLVWKRTLIHKVEYVQCNDAACVFYGNKTITALEPNNGGFLWTSRVKARPFLMTTSWGSRIVVFHNEYMIIYRQDTGSPMTHFRIKNCSRINYIQPVGVRLAVFCQHNVNLSSISLYIIPKSVLLHFTPQTQDKPIAADFVGYFKLPVRVHTYNDTVLYILHDRGVVSTLSVTERRVEDILNISADVREVLPINCTHTLVQTPDKLIVYTERGVVWRKSIADEHVTYIRRLSHNLILLKKNSNQLAILDIARMKEFNVDFESYQELLLVEGTGHTLFTASVALNNATVVRTIRYHD